MVAAFAGPSTGAGQTAETTLPTCRTLPASCRGCLGKRGRVPALVQLTPPCSIRRRASPLEVPGRGHQQPGSPPPRLRRRRRGWGTSGIHLGELTVSMDPVEGLPAPPPRRTVIEVDHHLGHRPLLVVAFSDPSARPASTRRPRPPRRAANHSTSDQPVRDPHQLCRTSRRAARDPT